jgi:hypothetical protein
MPHDRTLLDMPLETTDLLYPAIMLRRPLT